MLRKIGDIFAKIPEVLRRMMAGRYGSDRLNLLILLGSIVCSAVGSRVAALRSLMILSYALLFYAIFRTFSRNIEARQREASAYSRFKKFFTDREHRYFDCPNCSQTVRVPRGKGKITISCPRCGERFTKKT